MLPRNLIVLLLRIYRAVISPLYGQVCRYYPSCSAYGLGAVQQHGVVRGAILTAWRVLRCNPWSRGGVDDVPERRAGELETTGFGFVLGFGPHDAHGPGRAHGHHQHPTPHERKPTSHA
jgi:putative membrane protein insertion efficiency factor